MPNNEQYFAFFRDADQNTRRQELAAFFGPHADVFLKTYDKMRNDLVGTGTGKPKSRMFGYGFEVAAFFLGPVWFFYRKMWLMAWVLVALFVAFSVAAYYFPVLSRSGLILGILLATMAYRTYVTTAVTKLQKMRLADGSLDPLALREAGGVSKLAGAVSGTVFGLLYLVSIISIVYAIRHGISPQ